MLSFGVPLSLSVAVLSEPGGLFAFVKGSLGFASQNDLR